MSSYESVNVTVTDRLTAQPLVGVVMNVLSQDGRLVFGQVITDSTGTASLLLPASAVYQARFYQFGVSFSGALLLDVQEGVSNDFMAKGDKYQYPQATDPRLCIASGFFRTPTGGVAASVDMHFIGKFDPLLLDGSPILPERVTARTDLKGYVEVSLIRFGLYDVTLQGMEDYQRAISVPDTASVNIGDLLFPVVTAITFEENGPYTVAVGQDLIVHPHVFTSDSRELDDVLSDLLWSTSDSTALGLNPQKNSISVRGVKPGVYTLTAVRQDQSVIRIPNTPIAGVPLTVTVTA